MFRFASGAAIFAFAFFLAFASSSHFMPISQSSAESSTMSGNYYANITSSGSIDFVLNATPDGIGKVGKDTLSIDTNATSGYKLYLSTTSSAPGNGLYLEDASGGSSISGTTIDENTKATAITGTLSNPAKLTPNSWGYVPSRTSSSDTPTTYTDAAADAVTGSAVFAGVPEYGSEDVVYTNTTPNTSDTNTLDIYYGINFSTALPSGTYTNTVVYTAIVDAINPETSTDTISVSPASQNGLDAGTTLTIQTPLYPGFSASDLGNISVTIGGNACTGVTPSIDATNGNLVITCASPAAAAVGKADVVVSVAKYNKTWTLTEGYEYKYPVCSADTAVGATCQNTEDNQTTMLRLADGNFWTKSSQGSGTWDNVKDGQLCPSGTSMPSKSIFDTLVSKYSGGGLYNTTGWSGYYWSSTEYNSNVTYTLEVNSSSASVNPMGIKTRSLSTVCYRAVMQNFSAPTADATGTTYSLMDNRDSKIYSAKKLADGNIWMMANLELDLPAGQTERILTSADSDVTTSWRLTDNSNGTPGWCNQDTDACYNQSLISRTGYNNDGATDTAPTYYYNWYTATAGTGTSAIASGDVTDSICPKGWKLPTTAQFQALDQAYGGTGENRTDANQITNFTQNVGFGFTGYRVAASVYAPTSSAIYWSRSASSATYAYAPNFNSGTGNFDPRGPNRKWFGSAVRCVASS